MRSPHLATRLVAAAALASGVGLGATADAVPFSGTFTVVLELPNRAPYNPVVFTGLVGGDATVAPDGHPFQLPAGIAAINGLGAQPGFTSYPPPPLSFVMTADNGAGTFAGNVGPFAGTMPLSGV